MGNCLVNQNVRNTNIRIRALLISCPLGHPFMRIYSQADGISKTCQVCSQRPSYFFECRQCSYMVCLKHHSHSSFCPNAKTRCFRSARYNYRDKSYEKQCMLCQNRIYEITPAIKCQTCSFQSCNQCTPNRHQITKQIQYTPKEKGPSYCYDCFKLVYGGLTCKMCRNCFCNDCGQRFISKDINNVINQCSICLKEMKDDKINLACKHQFHGKCLASWKNRTCPNCRKGF